MRFLRFFFPLFFSIIWIGFCAPLAFAQKDIDSLKNALKIAPDTSVKRAQILLELCWRNRNKNIEDAKRYSKEALDLTQKLNLKAERAKALNFSGVIMRNIGNYEKAFDLFFDALSFSEKYRLKEQLGYANNNLGDIYKLQEDYEQAIAYIKKANSIFEEIKDLGGVAYTYLRLGEIYQQQKKYPDALYYFNKSLFIRKKINAPDLVVASMLRVGEVYYALNKKDTAMRYYTENLVINRKINNKRGIGYVLFQIGRIQWEGKKIKEALESTLESYEKASLLKENQLVQNTSDLLAKIYAHQNNFAEAYKYETIHAIAKEAVLSEEMKSRMEARQAKYVIDKHKNEIALLKKEDDLRKKETERQNTLFIAVAIIAILFFVFALIIAYFLRASSKNNKELQASRNELETQKNTLISTNADLESALEELNSTFEELQSTQEQLVESGKMAALGQLVAGVAHEINNPLGAIKASGYHILQILESTLLKMPAFFQKMPQGIENEFNLLISNALKNDFTLSSKEERKLKREWRSILSELKLNDIDVFAESLVEIGILPAEYEAYQHIFTAENAEENIHMILRLVELLKSGKIINTAVERASKIVFALKKFSHTDSSEKALPTHVVESLDTVITLYHNQIKRGIDLKCNFQEVPVIMGYPDELNQVWTNLIYNAMQAMDFKGTLELGVQEINQEIVVSVKDTGSGITPENQTKIFQNFFTTKPAGEGTGLGLSITKKIVEKHGGRILFESEVGKGTTFSVFLPTQNKL